MAGGISLARFSVTGNEMNLSGSVTGTLMQAIGADSGDLTLAVALDPTNQLGATVSAARIAGVDGATLQTALTAIAIGVGSQGTQVTVGGKQVLQLATSELQIEFGAPETAYIYTSSDVVFLVLGSSTGSSALVEAIP